MAVTITTKNVRITETKKSANETEARYSGDVEFEMLPSKTSAPMTLRFKFKDCVGMPQIMSRTLTSLEDFSKELRAAVRKERTNHGL